MMILFLRALIFAAFLSPSDQHQLQLQTSTGSWDTQWRDVMDMDNTYFIGVNHAAMLEVNFTQLFFVQTQLSEVVRGK